MLIEAALPLFGRFDRYLISAVALIVGCLLVVAGIAAIKHESRFQDPEAWVGTIIGLIMIMFGIFCAEWGASFIS